MVKEAIIIMTHKKHEQERSQNVWQKRTWWTIYQRLQNNFVKSAFFEKEFSSCLYYKPSLFYRIWFIFFFLNLLWIALIYFPCHIINLGCHQSIKSYNNLILQITSILLPRLRIIFWFYFLSLIDYIYGNWHVKFSFFHLLETTPPKMEYY